MTDLSSPSLWIDVISPSSYSDAYAAAQQPARYTTTTNITVNGQPAFVVVPKGTTLDGEVYWHLDATTAAVATVTNLSIADVEKLAQEAR